MYDENIDVTRIIVAAHQMRNQIIADLLRTAVQRVRDAVRNAAPGLKHHHAA